MTNIADTDQGKANDQLVMALAGNPNVGKTTLFNALTSLRQKVANYPGVTVESKEGIWHIGGGAIIRLIDLPGLYSLAATSLDEEIATNVLIGKVSNVPAPDVIIAVADATNLDRSLYLVTQLLDYKIPLVIALTMMDEAERANMVIDVEKLSVELQVPIVPVIAAKRSGIDQLEKIVLSAASGSLQMPTLPLSANNGQTAKSNKQIIERFAWIARVISETVTITKPVERTLSEKIDRVLTHKVFGLPIAGTILLIVFQALFSWATLPMELVDQGFGALGEAARNTLPAGLFTDLLVDGVIAGVGGILVFLPQIVLLFFFISILEDTGYMARVAFLLDRQMRVFGLHGKAFLPLMSSFACWIPGIMATRTIGNPKDRLVTILIAPLMSCSARLPIFVLIISAFFSGKVVLGFISLGALLMMAMYLLGIIVAVIVAWILKKTILKAPASPMVMELPPYRIPHFFSIFLNVSQRSFGFVKRTGTMILAISITLWFLATFPRSQYTNHYTSTTDMHSASQTNQLGTNVSDSATVRIDSAGEQLRNSYIGQLGHLIEPVIAPLGFDWKMGIGLITSFAATEVAVSTWSIIYNVGPDVDLESSSLIEAIRNAKKQDGSPAWTPLTALTMMVFFALAMQCMSTFAIVRRETNTWAWAFFMLGYMTVLAYGAAFLTHQTGNLLGFQ